jgi:invasion protein IalB
VGYAPGAGDTVTIIDNDGADAVTGTFAGLAEGALLLVDGVGWRVSYTGGDGNDVTLSARLTPGAPTGLSVTAGNGSATVSWQAPSATGGESIASYTVTGAPSGSCTATAPATTCTITGLTNGTTYTFTVTATNAVGTSAASAQAAVAPRTVPSAPTGVEVVTGALRATVSWVASTDDGGRPITAYTVTAQPDGATCTTTATTCTITGLRNTKAYTFTVTATNEAGTSGASTASTAVRPYRKLKMTKPRARGVRITSRVRVTGAATITQTATTSAGKTACRKRTRAKRKRTYTVACTLNRATRNALKKRTQTLTVTTTVQTNKGATFQTTHKVRAKKTRRR